MPPGAERPTSAARPRPHTTNHPPTRRWNWRETPECPALRPRRRGSQPGTRRSGNWLSGEKRRRISAMIGTGEIVTAMASGRMAPIPRSSLHLSPAPYGYRSPAGDRSATTAVTAIVLPGGGLGCLKHCGLECPPCEFGCCRSREQLGAVPSPPKSGRIGFHDDPNSCNRRHQAANFHAGYGAAPRTTPRTSTTPTRGFVARATTGRSPPPTAGSCGTSTPTTFLDGAAPGHRQPEPVAPGPAADQGRALRGRARHLPGPRLRPVGDERHRGRHRRDRRSTR